MRQELRTAPLALALAALGACAAAQNGTIAVIKVQWPDPTRSVTITAIRPDDAAFVRSSAVRDGICVLTDLPRNAEIELYYTTAPTRTRRYRPSSRVDDRSPWTGPWSLTIRAASVGGTPVRVASLAAVGADELDAELADLRELAAHRSPTVRDALYWSLADLAARAGKDAARRERIAAAVHALMGDTATAWAFEGDEARERFRRVGRMAAAAAGQGVELDSDAVREFVREIGALPALRETALRVSAARGIAMDPPTWQVVRSEAEDGSSPIAYAANLACARSPVASHQEVVLEGIRQEDAARYIAAVRAAQDAKLVGALPVVVDRVSTLHDSAMKRATISYLGSLPSAESVSGLGKLLGDADLAVKVLAANHLRALDSKRVALPPDLATRLDAVERVTVKEVMRPNRFRIGPGRL
ncbi:MAG: hypothetical protein IT208_07530 [Chthonomonadales bacterium]|nr:hypothetical protein [Chthonomonadales bacterium]